jgi:predicted acylesterase/phospholipase RssA
MKNLLVRCTLGVLVLSASLAGGLAGCSSPSRGPAVPVALIDEARIPGIPDARIFLEGDNERLMAHLREVIARKRAALGLSADDQIPDAHMLALSGGGSDGAFGAGILCAWTDSGTRPEFRVVTGVSTGALIAPFAFLGSEYDEVLRHFYTTMTDRDIFTPRGKLAGLTGDAMTDTGPLRERIAETFTQKELDGIARGYESGRLLFVATTNMDSGRPVIWDLGAIAASGHPSALELTRSILLASASIPVVFPPVMFDVEAGGQRYQELHSDGGAASQVFIYPAEFNLAEVSKELGLKVNRSIYVIRNSKLDPPPKEIKRRTMALAGRAVDSLIRTQGVGDIYRMYLESIRDGLRFHLAYIPEEFPNTPASAFDPVYMTALFQHGYDRMKSGTLWEFAPRGFQNVTIAPVAQ